MSAASKKKYLNPYPSHLHVREADSYFDDASYWSAAFTDQLPDRWKKKIESKFKAAYWGESRKAANSAMWQPDSKGFALVQLGDCPLPLNASDAEVCELAEKAANEVSQKILALGDAVRVKWDEWDRWEWSRDWMVGDRWSYPVTMYDKRIAGQGVCAKYGIDAPASEFHAPAVARMQCALWWRQRLRKSHAERVERAAIRLGFVRKGVDAYVSTEAVYRRVAQNNRNRKVLENTKLENELGQSFTLAELSDLGVANKAIRRGELMTRIKGFEVIARESKHVGVFVTLTCPSRMHKWADRKGGVFENRKYDGTSPSEAQQYLCKIWARIRAKLHREKMGVYGFRIAEPHHDGTPHWHLLMFMEQDHAEGFEEVMKHYALQDSPDEAGAKEHRCKFVAIDWSRGSAAGYIAKYVAKNIDGYKVGKDLIGMDAIESSARVEAWAATWRIRQFQQIGGAPVGVWRELRRIKEEKIEKADCEISYPSIKPSKNPDNPVMPEWIKEAWQAVHKRSDTEPARFDKYVIAQGGVFVGKNARIRVARDKEVVNQVGRYGDPVLPAIVGVEAVVSDEWRFGIVPNMQRFVNWVVESARHVWRRVSMSFIGDRDKK